MLLAVPTPGHQEAARRKARDISRMKSEASSRDTETASTKAALLALGVVYGDLGTSPLYTIQASALNRGARFTADAALGSLSLIVWALIIIISVKYC